MFGALYIQVTSIIINVHYYLEKTRKGLKIDKLCSKTVIFCVSPNDAQAWLRRSALA